MKISRTFHAVLDFGSAILLIASPWLFNFDDVQAAKTIAIVAGVLIIGMSLMTNYEAGLIRMIPMRLHLIADVFLGLFFIAAPWLFQFSDEHYLFFVLMGIVAILAGTFTRRESLNRIQ